MIHAESIRMVENPMCGYQKDKIDHALHGFGIGSSTHRCFTICQKISSAYSCALIGRKVVGGGVSRRGGREMRQDHRDTEGTHGAEGRQRRRED